MTTSTLVYTPSHKATSRLSITLDLKFNSLFKCLGTDSVKAGVFVSSVLNAVEGKQEHSNSNSSAFETHPEQEKQKEMFSNTAPAEVSKCLIIKFSSQT